MDRAILLIVAMAEKCKALIDESDSDESELPQALHTTHLQWMCDRIIVQAEEWSATKLHRWIGFVQCGMMANGILDFDRAKSMFDEAKNAYGWSDENDDLLDHLDSSSSFKLDIGGQG